MARLDGKVALISGAGSGIGQATAVRLASDGARLGLTDIDEARLEQTAKAVEAVGGEVVAVAGDVVEAATIDNLVAEAVGRFGRVDVLDNNVGILDLNDIMDVTLESFDRVMHVNCYSHLLAAQRVVPEMRKVGGGSIINIASVGGLVALPHAGAYCPSKSAVIGLTRSMAAEFAPDIRCNAVCPGGIDTPMAQVHLASFEDPEEATKKLTGRQMIKRYGKPEEIANVVAFLASDESSFMTGAVIPVEAGHTAW